MTTLIQDNEAYANGAWQDYVVIKAVDCKEVEDGYIISGPIASLKKDYDGETLHPKGVMAGSKMFFKLGAHLDYGHLYAESVRKGKPDPDLLIGKGLEVKEINGVPWLIAKLYKGLDLAEKVWKALRRGVEMGFSIEGLAKRRDPKDDKHVLETEIHRITIDPSPKGFDARIQAGMPSLAMMAKALATQAMPSAVDEGKQALDKGKDRSLRDAERDEEEGEDGPDDLVKAGTCPDCGGQMDEEGNCATCQGAGGMDKAVKPEAKIQCPKCHGPLYCIHCHRGSKPKQPAASTEKALTTGEGIVQAGAQGGSALRKQALRGTVADSSAGSVDKHCARCSKRIDSQEKYCAKCQKTLAAHTRVYKASEQDTDAAVEALIRKGVSASVAPALAERLRSVFKS